MQFFRGSFLAASMAALVSVGHAQNSPRRPDLNAFLNKRARSTAELVQHVKSDQRVMDRYMRHYAMTREGVVSFLSTLRPGKLEKGGVYRVYSVPEGGHIRANILNLRKGTPLFVDASGRPVLVAICGNPFETGSPPVVENPEGERPGEMVESPGEIPVPEPAIETNLIEPAEPGFEPVPLVDRPEVILPPAGRGLGFAPIGGLLGLLGSATLLIGDNERPQPPPVPEPATMLAMAAGLGGLAVRRRAKRSR